MNFEKYQAEYKKIEKIADTLQGAVEIMNAAKAIEPNTFSLNDAICILAKRNMIN